MKTEPSGHHLATANALTFAREEIERSIVERFTRVAKIRGAAPAVRVGEEHLTYTELDRRSDALAAAIARRATANDAPIALLLADQIGAIVGLLATWKAGRSCIPLDHTFPPGRLDVILSSSEPALVVTDEDADSTMAEVGNIAERHLRIAEVDFAERVAPHVVPTTGRSIACLFYTSGSTGEPKGVIRTHGNLLQRVRSAIHALGMRPDDRVSGLHSPAFGVGLRDTMAALLSGATLLPFDLRRAGVGAFASWIAREKITVLCAVVTTFRHLVASLDPGVRFDSVRIVRLGSEAAFRQDLEQFRERFGPDCVLITGYGASEASGIAEYRLEPGKPLPAGRVPAGYPLGDVEILILDEDGRPVEQGATGEIAVRSSQLSPGYWRQPELTEKAFQSDPSDAGLRIYHTGDVGRLEPDGCLEILGRKDHRLKVRGYLVHPGEVEVALLAHPAIREGVVVGRPNARGETGLVAYVVPVEPPVPAAGVLRRFLGARLPAYMVPFAFVALEAFPMNATGKVDRAALPPVDLLLARTSTFAPPRTSLERQIAKIWEELLEVEPVGIFDDFFDLGGDSLLAAALVTSLEHECGRVLPPAMLLECSTVADLAAALLREKSGAGETTMRGSPVAIQRGAADGPALFCVPGHAGTVLCFHQLARQLGPKQSLYGFEPRGLDGRSAPHPSVEAMAAAYVDDLRAIQPEGPYFLGGYCFGGLVAFEMAQQLRAQGERIGLLALFETPGQQRPEAKGLTRLTRRVTVERANLAGLGLWQKLAYVAAKGRAVTARIGAVAERRRSLRARIDRERDALSRAQRIASRAYAPKPYAGPVMLFWAQRPFARRFVDPRFGWGGLVTEGLEVRPVPVATGSLIQEPDAARVVAAELRARLEAAEGQGAGAAASGSLGVRGA